MRVARLIRNAVLLLLVVYVGATAARVYSRKYYIFLPAYAQWLETPATATPAKPTHIFFLMTDHFEPDKDVSRVQNWTRRYREMASRHRDSDGRPPQHGWFYQGE